MELVSYLLNLVETTQINKKIVSEFLEENSCIEICMDGKKDSINGKDELDKLNKLTNMKTDIQLFGKSQIIKCHNYIEMIINDNKVVIISSK